MISEGSVVKGWAISTQSKIKQFVDEYLIGYPQENVRKSTEKLLASLFRKGTQVQRLNIISLLTDRVQILDSMGKSSKEFLSLITNIFENFQSEDYAKEKETLFNSVIAKTKEIFRKTINGKEYNFYSLCANMIDFGGEFKPYLLEANGCLKCYGKPQIEFENTSLNNIRDELRVHLNYVEWILKRKYEINNLQVTFSKKKIGFKTITIYAFDDTGAKKELGKYTPNDTIPPFNVTTNAIGISFQFAKPRRGHVNCLICSNAQEYSSVCSSCILKLVDMEAKVKVVAGNPEKISKQLSESFKSFSSLRNQLEKFSQSVEQESKVSFTKMKIIQEMEGMYLNIIQNLRLLRDVAQNELISQKVRYQALCTDCYSCHFYQFNACIEFILNSLKKSLFSLSGNKILELIQDFRNIFSRNQIHSNSSNLSFILAELFSKIESINYFQQITLNKDNNNLVADLLMNLIQHIKKEKKDDLSSLIPLKRYIFEPQINKYFTVLQKIHFFVVFILNEEQFFYLNETQDLDPQKLQDLKRLSLEQYAQYNTLLSFSVSEIFNYNINNIVKLYLVLLPEQLIPVSNLDINDPGYLKYIKTVLPQINEEYILSNVVFSPNPIIKLNLFKLLPQIIQQLPLESSIELIKQLCKFRTFWNTYIIETVQSFDKMLDEVEKQRRLMLCLEGYEVSKQNLYFQHIFKLLTPQRPSFIIRLEIPEKEMQKEEKNKGGPVEYIYLPTRQVKSEDLKGDTIGALHGWITEECKKMNQDMAFDLIVQNNIVDNLELSLEIIYKKIVQKQAKRQIGNKSYDFFRVIYRIQGIFGEANERNCGNPRDEKLQQCINFSSYLLNRLPNKKTGLDILMDIIPTLDQKNESRERRDKMIKILEIIFRNETIIRKVVQWEYGNYILNLTVKFISLNKYDLRSTETLLEMCSKIIDEANKEMIKIRKNSGFSGRKNSDGDMDIEDGEESQRAVKFILEKVKEADQNGLKNISKKLIKILPFCSKDDIASSKYLIEYFEMANILELKYTQKLTWLLQFIQALSQSYFSFKTLCRDQGITTKIIDFVIAGLGTSQNDRSKDIIENLELCIIVLKGLIQGDLHLQDYLFEKGILQEIYKVGGVGSSGLTEESKAKLGKIPSVCFEIVKYFQEGKIISPHVHEYFAENEERKRKAIQTQKNQRKLQIMNKKKKVMESFQHLIKNEENELLSCSSCKEGYSKKKEVLGVYLYSSKIEILSLENWWKDNKKVQSITSTSYFEPIHLQCHNNAMKDDLKIQKTEWDGAIIRNSEVLCNNWCAFKGAETTDEEFDKVFRKYFQKNNKASGFWMVINDLNGLLEKFSKEFNFAQETKGSSYTHNAKLIPVLIVFACHLMKSNEEVKYLKEGITYIEQHLTKKPNLINLYFCLLLFHCNLQSLQSKRIFCLKLIDHLAYGNFKDSKPFYVYLALIQSIMKLTHKCNNEGFEVLQYLSAFIPRNFNSLVQSFEVIAEQYKNTYLKWQTAEQARKYFQI